LTDKNGIRILPILEDMSHRENAVLIVNLACDDDQAQINAYVAAEHTAKVCAGIVSLAETGNCREVIVYCGETNADALIASLKVPAGATLTVSTGPASPVLRDETALYSAIESGGVRVNRAEHEHARTIPSYGYSGRPTLVVDAETAFQAGRLKTAPNAGITKFVTVIGGETAIIEALVGTSLAELLKDRGFEGTALIGGTCGRFVKSEAFDDTYIDFSHEFDSVRLFSGSDCVVDALANLYMAAKEQSCAKCVMCREGSWQLCAIFSDITNGRSNRDDIALIEDICPIIQAGALCTFGRNMIMPALSAATVCRDDLEKHVAGRNCPVGKCAGLMKYVVDPSLCTGCGDCIDSCPEEAIDGKDGFIHVIDEKLCEKCGDCVDSCPEQAIKTDSGRIKTPKKPIKVGRFSSEG